MFDFLAFFDFDAELKFENGTGYYRLIDTTGANLGNIESERFYSIPEITDRLDVYYHDYIYQQLSDESLSGNPYNLYRGGEDYSNILEWLKSNEEFSAFIPVVECIIDPYLITDSYMSKPKAMKEEWNKAINTEEKHQYYRCKMDNGGERIKFYKPSVAALIQKRTGLKMTVLKFEKI